MLAKGPGQVERSKIVAVTAAAPDSGAAVVAIGFLGALMLGPGRGEGGIMCMVAMALGSGLAFPLVALRFPSNLVHFFVADMIGGMLGGPMGIWIPLLLGINIYYSVLPWAWIVTIILGALTVWTGPAEESG